MHRILVGLFCVTFVVSTSGASLQVSTSIQDDAIELARLMEQFWSLKPATLLNYPGPLRMCQWIDDCCGAADRSKAMSFMISKMRAHTVNITSLDVINICTNAAVQNKLDQSCPSILHFSSSPGLDDIDDPAVKSFASLIDKYRSPVATLLTKIGRVCNIHEYHAFFCLSNKKLVQSCATKMVQDVLDYKDYDYYQGFMTKMKQGLTDLNQELAHLPVKNTNTDCNFSLLLFFIHILLLIKPETTYEICRNKIIFRY